jgi:hypothetical protein
MVQDEAGVESPYNAQMEAQTDPKGVVIENLDGVIAHDERRGTLIFAAFLTGLGLFWIYASSDLADRQQTAYLSQGFLPVVSGVLLAALSAMLFLSTWLTKFRPAKELGKEQLFEPSAQIRGAAVFGVLLLYIIALPHVHYAVNTFFLMAAGLALAREPIRPRLFVLAAVISGIFFSIFVWGLQIALPGSIYS